jgi:hypothetical protein
MDGSVQLVSGLLSLGKNPGTHSLVGQVGPRNYSDVLYKRLFLARAGNRTLVLAAPRLVTVQTMINNNNNNNNNNNIFLRYGVEV